MPKSANEEWLSLLKKILDHGTPTEVRGQRTLEILANQTVIDMSFPVVTNKARNLGYRFMAAEAWWILTGQNTVSTIAPYSKEISRFSDDGYYFSGAYGPAIVDQLTYICDSLEKDPNSRQAVLCIWRKNPRDSKDIPCTVSVQWFIRDDRLHCVDTMRSSDAWLGWPYDVFNFSMLSGHILNLLGSRDPNVFCNLELGNLYLNAGSQHLYEKDLSKAAICLGSPDIYGCSAFDPVDLEVEWGDVDPYLKYLKDYQLQLKSTLPGFLNELFEKKYGVEK